MKLSVGLLALACAASATPLRVIVVSNTNGEAAAHHPASVGPDGKLEPAVAHLNVIKPQQAQSGVHAHAPCGTGARQHFRFREKATAFADEVRIAFGFKPSSHWHGYQHPPKFEELKMLQPPPRPDCIILDGGAVACGGIGGKGGAGLIPGKDGISEPPVFVDKDGKKHTILPPPPFPPVPPHLLPPPPIPVQMFDLEHPHHPGHRVHPHPEHFHRMHHGHWRHGQPSFMMRVHFALMSLGPWEGRAVAFVLGCGIGVLLRMFWVLTVLTYRAVRGPSSSSSATYAAEQYVILESEDGEDAEEIFVAPPMYTYPVEKVALPVEVEREVPAIVVSEAEAEEAK